MARCISAMIFIPIYLIIDLIKMFYSVITNIINFLKQRRITQQEEKNRNYKNDKKITKKQVYHKSKPVFHQSPPLEFRAYKENNYLILENDYFKLKYYELVDSNFIFYYTLKWNNGSYFGGNFGVNNPILNKPFNLENYEVYFYNSFKLAKKNYKKIYNKEYNYFDNDSFNKKGTI